MVCGLSANVGPDPGSSWEWPVAQRSTFNADISNRTHFTGLHAT